MVNSSEVDGRPPDNLDFDVIIIGAGISGMYQLYRLRERDFRIRVFEAGTAIAIKMKNGIMVQAISSL